MCWDGTKKPKKELQLNLTRNTNNKKGFYRKVRRKRKIKEGVHPPMLHFQKRRLSNWEKPTRLRYSATFLPQSSMAISLPTLLEWVDCKTGTERKKSFPLEVKIKLMAT